MTGAVKGLVLAGGKGTRLRPLTYCMAKQLVPVANKPILHYALEELYKAGVRDFGIIVNPETAASIEASIARWERFTQVSVTYIPQDAPSGLAHAVKIAEPFLQDSPFIMYLGDNLINANLAAWVDAFLSGPEAMEASILLTPVDNPSSFGIAELNADGGIRRLVEKPEHPPSNLALIGVYLMRPSIFQAIAKIKPSWRGELEITDALQQLITDGHSVKAHIHEGWWLDTGKKDDLLAANQIVLREFVIGTIEGTVNDISMIEGQVDIGPGTEVINSHIIGPVRIGANCRIENAWIGPNTSIGDGSQVVHSQVENSVFLENCVISHVPNRIEDSLCGQGCRITKTPAQSQQYLLADHSEILVG
jgi:glucose-1-phosphate thymidylyltransferase